MAIAQITKRDSHIPGYFYEETVADGLTGDTVPIPPLHHLPTCTLIPAGGASGYFEFSTSSDAAVAAGTATFQTWPLGTVSSAASDALLAQVTALRIVSVAGNVTGQIVV